MRHRLLEGCLNPWKHHLWRLPDIPEGKQLKLYDYKNEFLAFIPLFTTREGDHSLEHHIVRAAC